MLVRFQKRHIGNFSCWFLTLGVVPVWLISFPHTTLRHPLPGVMIYTSQLMALMGFCLFALTFVLVLRSKKLEPFFGGLDKMYAAHHTMGKLAGIALCLHPLTLALAWLLRNPEKALWYVFPVHRRVEINLGSWALWVLIVLLMVTVIIRLPYDKWKVSHKLMGIPFFLGVAHVFLIDSLFDGNLWLKVYLIMMSASGTLAYLYKTLGYTWLKKNYKYKVSSVKRMNDAVIEIGLTSTDGSRMSITSGQFAFFSFISKDLTREYHPYTITRHAGQILYIMVKALGDYTQALYDKIRTGVPARIDGPYGVFHFSTGSAKQIWIGGGVGIAPYLSWINALLEKPDAGISFELYYCCRTEGDACYAKELEKKVKSMPKGTFRLISTDTQGLLNLEQIDRLEDKDIFICGPKPMRQSLTKQAKQLGVPKSRIHSEDFDFI